MALSCGGVHDHLPTLNSWAFCAVRSKSFYSTLQVSHWKKSASFILISIDYARG